MRLLVLLSLLTITSCATQKQWTATGGSRADGTVELSYEYGPFESPNITASQGVPLATQRCRAWGYNNAEPFGGVRRQCSSPGGFGGCNLWYITAQYQCTTRSAVPAQIPEAAEFPESSPAAAAPTPSAAVGQEPAINPYAPKPKELPKNDYTAGKLARTLGCSHPTLISMSSSTETFQAPCPGGQHKIIQCEFSNCRVLQ